MLTSQSIIINEYLRHYIHTTERSGLNDIGVEDCEACSYASLIAAGILGADEVSTDAVRHNFVSSSHNAAEHSELADALAKLDFVVSLKHYR